MSERPGAYEVGLAVRAACNELNDAIERGVPVSVLAVALPAAKRMARTLRDPWMVARAMKELRG